MLFIVFMGTSIKAGPFEDDTLIVRQILNAAGDSNSSVMSRADTSNGRIDSLYLYQPDTLIGLIDQLDSLTRLNIYYLKASALPTEITKLTNLTKLIIYGAQNIKSVPYYFKNFSKLKYLDMHNCPELASDGSFLSSMVELEYLDLSSTKISELPTGIGNLTKLEVMKVNNTMLTNIPDEIGNCVTLGSINANNCYLTTLPNGIGNLSNLQTLYINNNNLASIPASIGKLDRLKYLQLDGNQLLNVPDSLGECDSLISLSISDNPLRELSSGICNLKKIETLAVAQCSLSTLPDSIGKLKTLVSLYVSYSPLDSLPVDIANLNSLMELFIEGCNLNALPETFGGLKNLTYLHANNNNFIQLPDSIGNCINLTNLYLKNNKINSLPQSFSNLSKLEVLYLDHNQLTDGVSEFKDLNALRYLHVTNNNLNSISYGVKLEKLYADNNLIDTIIIPYNNNLREIYIKHNKISNLNWYDFGKHGELRKIDLSYNELTEAFTTITDGNYNYLSKLYINNNKITKLGDNLSAFTYVDTLDLSNNLLDSISDEILQMPRLRYLSLSHNPNIKLTDSLMSISNLNMLDISNCNLDSLPRSISNLGRNGKVWDLNIDSNNITTLPFDAYINADLWGVWWGYNDLDTVNDSLFLNPNLRSVGLYGNNLTTVPEGLKLADTLFMIFNVSGNNIEEIPEWFGSMRNLKMVGFENNLLTSLPDTLTSIAPEWWLGVSGNKICDPVSTEMDAWLDKYDFQWPNNQNCDIPENPLVLSAKRISTDMIEISWDTASVNDTDLEFSQISFRMDNYPVSVNDYNATVIGKYPVYSKFKDTLTGVEDGKMYYFSGFVGDYVDFWSDTTAKAKVFVSTHDLNLTDTLGNNNLLVSTMNSVTGVSNIFYKIYNTDLTDSLANVAIYYKNGSAGNWTTLQKATGDFGSVKSNDSSVIKTISWNLKNEFGKDFVSDSIQLMITASAKYDLADTLKMGNNYIKIDFTEIPENVTNLKATAISENEISLTWTKSISSDVDSQFICYNSNGIYPSGKSNAEKVIGLSSTESSYSVTSLNEKSWYNFIILVKDSAGNFSSVDTNSSDSARTFDVTAPDNVKNIVTENLSYSSTKLKWMKPDSLDAESLTVIISTDSVFAMIDTFSNTWFKMPIETDTLFIDSLKEQTKYYLVFFVNDSAGNMNAGKTFNFSTTSIGNILPVITLNEISSEQSGDVNVLFNLSDVNKDSLYAKFKYSKDGVTWSIASVSGDTSKLAYSEYNGIGLNIVWHSATDIPNHSSDSVYFAAVPYDPANGIEDMIIINIDNYHNQSAAITTPLGVQQGDVKFIVSVTDTTNDVSSLSYYYSTNNNLIWQNATNITIIEDTLIWHSDSIFSNVNVKGVQFKVVPNDGWQDGIAGITDTFSIQNLTTYMSGDYDKDGKIAFSDFSYVSTYYNLSANGVKDPVALDELAPYSGSAPYLTVTPDSLYDYKDLGAFIKMYYWSKENIDSSRSFVNVRSAIDDITDFSIKTDDSVVTLKLAFNSLEDIVACRYRIIYKPEEIVYNSFTEGEFLKRGRSNLLKVSDNRTGEIEVGLARISTGDLAVSGDGIISDVVFNKIGEINSSVIVEYSLINSQHEVVVSNRETVDFDKIPEDNKVLSVVPSVSKSSDNYQSFELIQKDNIIEDIIDDEKGFAIQISLPEKLKDQIVSGELKIFNQIGNLIDECSSDDISEAAKEPMIIYWSGRDRIGNSLATGTYILLFRYSSESQSKTVKKLIGIKW